MAGTDALLALAVDLERRDAAAAAALEQLGGLARRADELGERATEVHAFLDAYPGRLADLDRLAAEARDERAAADAELADADQAVAAAEKAGRRREEVRREAARRLARAEQNAADAAARVEWLATEADRLRAAEADALASVPELVEDARAVSRDVTSLPRVSASGREAPEGTLEALPDWAARVHAALFVVRSQLESERERVVREANELGTSVLGEQTAGASVSLVRRRLEEALRR